MGIRGRLFRYRVKQALSDLRLPKFEFAFLKWIISGLLLLLLILAIVFAVLLLDFDLSSEPEYVVSNGNVLISTKGYYFTCDAGLTIEHKINGRWLDVSRDLPRTAPFKLDGLVNRNGFCHIEICIPIDEKITAPLTKYVKTGTEDVSAQDGFIRPVYRTEQLYGEVKLSYTYYKDAECTKPEVFETVLLV